MLFCDNGSEFTSQVLALWAYHNQVKIDFSRPGKPTDNAYVESFNGTLRAECLDAHWFGDLAEARQRIEAWRTEYNASCPHRVLGERTPNEFARQIAASRHLPCLECSKWLNSNELRGNIGAAEQVYFVLADSQEQVQTRHRGGVYSPSCRMDVEGICPIREA